MSKLLQVNDLTTEFTGDFGKKISVDHVSFDVAEGETVCIVGESGCGKSVTSLSIMGLLGRGGTVTEGSVVFEDKNLLTMTEKELDKIRGDRLTMIFQDPLTSLDPVFTVGNQLMESIRKHMRLSKEEARKRAEQILGKVGMPDPHSVMKKYPHTLSGGMRQRVVIAIAVACNPQILICDEPTTALDVTIQAQILELMQDLRKKLGMSIIMITHDLGVVASMCEKIAVMYAGHIVEYGTTDEIFYQPGHEYTKGLINSIPKLNTAEHERLVPIEGTPVDLLNPPAGCPFAPRCKNCMKICLSKMPPRTELSDTHYTYCWLQQKAAFEKGEKAE